MNTAKCEFIQGRKKNPITGTIGHDIHCDRPAVKFQCRGELGSIEMLLCEFHKNFVASHYKWKVEPVSEAS